MSRKQQQQQQPRRQPTDGGRSHQFGGIHINEAEEMSEYEIERRRTMERNNRKLQELGLVSFEIPAHAAPARKTGKGGLRSRASIPEAPKANQAHALRRSPRGLGKASPPKNAVGFDVGRGVAVNNGERSRKKQRPDFQEDHRGPQLDSVLSERRAKAKLLRASDSSSSSINLDCDVARLMGEHLGRRFTASGKATVMDLATRSRPLTFSRMSGVTEWRNAIFIWINVGVGGGYTNIFERGPAVSTGRSRGQENPSERPAILDPSHAVTTAGEAENKLQAVGGGDNGTNRSPPRKPREFRGKASFRTACVSGGLGSSLRMTWYASARTKPEYAIVQRLLKSKQLSDVGPGGRYVAFADALPPPPSPPCSSARVFPEKSTATADRKPAGIDSMLPIKSLRGSDDTSGATESEMERNVVVADNPSVDRTKARNSVRPNASDCRKDDDTVLLFCRLANQPYVFCGRLGFEAYWPGAKPMRFLWRLLDAERLAGYPDFAEIVEAAAMPLPGAQNDPCY